MAEIEMTKTEFDAAIKEAVEKGTTELKNKNNELLGEVKGFKSKLDGIDLDQLQADSKAFAELKTQNAEKNNEYKELYEKSKGQLDTLKTESETREKQLRATFHDTLKKKDIAVNLAAHNIIPELSESALNLILPEVEITDANEAMVGAQTVTEYIADWVKTDVGKHFVKSGKSGGGGPGSKGKGADSDSRFYDKKHDDYSVTEQARIAKEDPALHKQLKKRFSS